MAAAAPSTSANVSKDNVQRMHRITRSKRSLWYQLTVLQQPERARACGAGMKANSDRRPVDPPPVVELRIIEGPSFEDGKDITFDYNAAFFLYASLEHARPIATARGQAPANPPILTGVPASGMAYLDRPCEAGYFIFPDLSVRHEGNFRLSFSLFETTKEEKDWDIDPPRDDGSDWRMDIKTHPFNVFSAKKFPGLMESTSLSKIVADQGCRVRIRRDVRMRKRDSKPAPGTLEAREEVYRKPVAPAPTKPDGTAAARDRSLSNSSDNNAHQPVESERRPSAADSHVSIPPTHEPAALPTRHLSFGNDAPPIAPSHRPTHHHAIAPRPTSSHMPPISVVPPQQRTRLPSRSESDRPYVYPSMSITPRATLSPPSSTKPETQEPRLSISHVSHPPSPFSSRYDHTRRSSYAPIRPPTPPYATGRPLLPHAPPGRTQQQLKISALISTPPPIEPQTEPPQRRPDIPTGGKRKHESVFYQTSKPLHNGQRQVDAHYKSDLRRILHEPDQYAYSRADGEIGYVQFNSYH